MRKKQSGSSISFHGSEINRGKFFFYFFQESLFFSKDEESRKKNVVKSIELAKNALNLDFKDGESWYVLGNAYMFNFFVNMTLITELNNALKAYNQAEANLNKNNPDLHFNRANVRNCLI